jgi:hypothetical protein
MNVEDELEDGLGDVLEAPAGQGAGDEPPPVPRRDPWALNVRGLVKIGLVIAVIAVIGLLVRDRLSIGATDLRVGDCIDQPPSMEVILTLQHRPCSEPHDGEVVFVGDYPGLILTTYPGEEAFTEFASETCIPAFEAYTGVALADAAELDVWFLYPHERGWMQGDHEVACYLFRIDGETITGSRRAGD